MAYIELGKTKNLHLNLKKIYIYFKKIIINIFKLINL